VLLLKSVSSSIGSSGVQGSTITNGVMGVAPVTTIPAPTTQHLQEGDVGNHYNPPTFHFAELHVNGRGLDSEQMRQWIPKMDFPWFDGSDVRVRLDKCAAYFQLYLIPLDFRVIVASLHMIDKASARIGFRHINTHLETILGNTLWLLYLRSLKWIHT
jgi:hypothetical protein